MRIAQVAPIFESVPPKAYGGTERVVSYLTEELVRQGHEVTLFASGDSLTSARLVSPIDRAIRADPRNRWLAYHEIQMDMVAELAAEFDVIHFHTDYLHFPLARRLGVPSVSTLHGRLDLPELPPVYQRFFDLPLISISKSQRRPMPWGDWRGTVYHGLPRHLYSFCGTPDNYFAFVGRISPEKGIDRAIAIAKACDIPLYIGAKIDAADETYYKECIKPLLQHPLIEYLGEVSQSEKRELLEHAKALLFPVNWPEPFGLVLIESFCCGTPVIAYRHGSVPEIMEDGVTGFLVSKQDEAILAARRIDTIDRRGCRAVFERRFTVTRMAEDYLRIYRQIVSDPLRMSAGA